MSTILPISADSFIFQDKFEQIIQDRKDDLYNNLAQYLAPIEQALAKHVKRTVSPIYVTPLDTPQDYNEMIAPDSEPIALSKRRSRTYHRDGDEPFHNLEYNPLNSGLYFLASLYHEAEHAAQWEGNSYTKIEKRMCNICKTLYDRNGNTEEYRNNYAEVKARIAEANFALAACQRIQQRNPKYALHDNVLLFLEHVHTELTTGLSQENMRNLLSKQKLELKELAQTAQPHNLDRLNHEFRKFPVMVTQQAKVFLMIYGEKLYESALKEAQETAQTLRMAIENIKTQRDVVAQENERKLKREDRDKMYDIASQYPMISQLPIPLPKLQFATHNSRMMQQSLEKCTQLYNVAIYHDNQDNFTVIADTEPTPREYSANPQLKEKWDQLHPELLQTDNEYSTEDLVFDEDR